MANTLKFGNGKFAVKEGSALAYNDENGNFKPLPFTFDRSTSATRVNKQGLIEVVSNNEPRIDFLNDSKGALLLEPSRSNLLIYSEDFNNAYWTKLGTAFTITSNNAISPSGELNASTINVTNNDNLLYRSVSGLSSSQSTWNFSIYAKGSGTFDMNIRLNASTISTETKTLTNEWQRFNVSATRTPTITSVESFIELNTSSTYQIWGAQVEESYATSYIPTQGSIGTRVAESCNGAGNDQVINSAEGVLYYESKVNSLIVDKAISVSTGSYNDSVSIGVYGGVFQSRIRQGGNFIHFISPSGVNLLNNNKIAIMYSQSNIKIFVNGSLKSTVSGVTYSVNLSKVSFTRADITDKFYGLIKDLRVYNTALTDQELINLTKI